MEFFYVRAEADKEMYTIRIIECTMIIMGRTGCNL